MRWTLLLPLLLLASCFPEFPDDTLVHNLRVLAVRVDPPEAVLGTFPPPVIRVTALTVDPADPELGDHTHVWSLELPDDADAGGLEDLLPEGPYGTTLEIDLGAVGAPEERGATLEWVLAALPLNYRVESADDHREAVKLVQFLFPQIVEGDDDDSAGADDDDDDDSAADDDDFVVVDDDDTAEPPPTFEPPEPNLMPSITSLTIGDRVWNADDLPADDSPLYIGEVADDEGITLDVVVADDGDLEDLSVELFRTAGCPNLPIVVEGGRAGGFFGGAPEQAAGTCPEDEGGGFGGGGFGNDEDEDFSKRSFEWIPVLGEASAGTRLFLILRDGGSAQTWLELRPEAAPE